VGIVTEESFCRRVEELRKAGARYVFLKTGAYRPADPGNAVEPASARTSRLRFADPTRGLLTRG
jgi:hypothetical protein